MQVTVVTAFCDRRARTNEAYAIRKIRDTRDIIKSYNHDRLRDLRNEFHEIVDKAHKTLAEVRGWIPQSHHIRLTLRCQRTHRSIFILHHEPFCQ